MKRKVHLSSALSILTALLLGGSGAVGGGARRVGGHIPHKQIQQARHMGRHASGMPLTLAISLNPRDPQGLNELLTGLYDPADPRYHQFLSPAEFKARYAPSDADVGQVVDYFQSRGLRVSAVHENNLVINVEGSTASVENAFQVEVHDYRTSDGRAAFAAVNEPLVLGEAGNHVLAVNGLNSFEQRRTHRKRISAQLDPNALSGHAAITDYMTPTKVRKAYGLDAVAATGTGETIALFELDGYAVSDITHFASQFSLTTPTLQNVLIDGASGAAGADTDEVCLDIEVAMALAPGLSKIMVYEGPNTDAGVIDTYSHIASDNLAKEVSTSWGSAEDGNTVSFRNSENTIFQQMASQGQSIFAAAGDGGAYDDPARPASAGASSLEVDDPASQPYVTGVGGTTLSSNITTGAYTSESSWGSGTQGGGGGNSSIWAQPSWQANLATSANKGSATMRMVPDVSLDANPTTGYPVYSGGAWYAIGGTSASAPLWAAFAAIVNQGRLGNSLARLGFANPSIYQVANSGLYASTFHDVADGTTNLFYPAVTGFDLSTGWGTIKGLGLYAALSAGTLPPSAPASLTLITAPSSLTASWTASAGATSYTIYRSTSGAAGTFSVLASGIGGTSYVDSSPVGVNYYQVTAVNSAGESAASVVQSGAANQAAPGVPTNLTATVIR